MKKVFYTQSDVCMADFKHIMAAATDGSECTLSTGVEKGVILYDAQPILQAVLHTDTDTLRAYKNEMCYVLDKGAGVFAVTGLYTDTDMLDRVMDIFVKIHAQQGDSKGDHFAKAGKNLRIWNGLQKLAVLSPEDFIQYYKNPVLDVICCAWLGTGYQITSQINGIKPGGKAQNMHRDYHLGFQSNKKVESFPLHMQLNSQYLTLQGAIAHINMPIKSGPTQLLPHSQKYDLGYMAWRNPDFIAYYKDNFVQLALKKGDGVFFNPALFHAGGDNFTDDIDRNVNLLQVSSAFGKTMETLNYKLMIESVYPALQFAYKNGEVTSGEVYTVAGCIADGYAFPTNLEKDIPQGEVSPQTLQNLVAELVLQGVSYEEAMIQVTDKMKVRTDG